MIVGLWALAALAGEGRVDALLGVRTAPDAALEQPSEWEPEVEPTAVAAVVAGWQASQGQGWWAAEGSIWGFVPEADAALIAVGPRGGIGASAGAARLELAGRYDAQIFPFTREAISGRAEGLVKGTADLSSVMPEISVEALDRHYPFQNEWSFRTLEPGGGITLRPGAGRFRARAAGGWQLNQGWTVGTDQQRSRATGTQIRGTAELGWSSRRWEVWSIYGIIHAREGQVQNAARPQFTPVGDYAADADALSAGGFLQHRVEVGASAEIGEYRVRASALYRTRASEKQDLASFDRTLHGQVDLDRELSEDLSFLAALGSSGARLVGGAEYIDIYGWVGLSWALGSDDDIPSASE